MGIRGLRLRFYRRDLVAFLCSGVRRIYPDPRTLFYPDAVIRKFSTAPAHSTDNTNITTTKPRQQRSGSAVASHDQRYGKSSLDGGNTRRRYGPAQGKTREQHRGKCLRVLFTIGAAG